MVEVAEHDDVVILARVVEQPLHVGAQQRRLGGAFVLVVGLLAGLQVHGDGAEVELAVAAAEAGAERHAVEDRQAVVPARQRHQLLALQQLDARVVPDEAEALPCAAVVPVAGAAEHGGKARADAPRQVGQRRLAADLLHRQHGDAERTHLVGDRLQVGFGARRRAAAEHLQVPGAKPQGLGRQQRGEQQDDSGAEHGRHPRTPAAAVHGKGS